MGNEHSNLSGIQIEEKAIEVSDHWSHHSASIENTPNLTVLVGELLASKNQTPLETNSKHLMIYRHPCIVKYISSWHKGTKFYLATEEVTPLSQALPSLNTLQIGIGLHAILKALCFLHEKAQISHNNVCIASIYVTKDGNWKLAGMQHACKFAQLTSDYLQKTRPLRYSKAVDSNEDKFEQSSTRKDLVDVFAFSALVNEVLKTKSDDEIPSLSLFRNMCKDNLQNLKIEERLQLPAILDHEFFNHDFIAIHSFLVELPLKPDQDKIEFFSQLGNRLGCFSESTVANQLTNLLLCRMVLLDKTAQQHLLPYILCPKNELEPTSDRLFSDETFKKHLVPKLLEIFSVRDAQIRLLLLTYFKHFAHTFSKEELQTCILPELLVGVKDTNDKLVAATLVTLADLVLILGSSIVIGGKRAKLFNDGRPIAHKLLRSCMKASPSSAIEPIGAHPIVEANQLILNLPERQRPDGEEEETSTEEVETVEEDLDNWEDWDANEGAANSASIEVIPFSEPTADLGAEEASPEPVLAPIAELVPTIAKKPLPDIDELDIKNQARTNGGDDVDFFQDMEPVIEAASKFVVDEFGLSTKLNITEVSHEDGWVDDEWD